MWSLLILCPKELVSASRTDSLALSNPAGSIFKEPHRAGPEINCAIPDLSETVCSAILFALGRRWREKAQWLWRASTCTPRRRLALPFPLHEAGAAMGGKRPRGSRERALLNVKSGPKDSGDMAHQQLQCSFSISFEELLAQPKLRASKSSD